jgi:hypothetical protein
MDQKPDLPYAGKRGTPERVKRGVTHQGQKAVKRQIKNFTGLDAPYEAPDAPDTWLKTVAGAKSCGLSGIEARLRPNQSSPLAKLTCQRSEMDRKRPARDMRVVSSSLAP